MERPAEMCSLETFLLQIVTANDKVIIIADTRHTQRWSDCEVDPMLCKGDLAFSCNCTVSLGSLRLWAHEHTPGIPRDVEDLETVEFADVLSAIAEDQHLTRCAQVCFTGTEEDQAEQRDQGTIDEVLGDQDKEGGDALHEDDREAGLLEQMPPLGHLVREKTCSILVSSSSPCSRRDQAITSKLATSTERRTRADVTCCPSSTRLHQCRQDFRCQGCDNAKPRPQKHAVGVDVFKIVDSVGIPFSILSAVCMGTTYDQA